MSSKKIWDRETILARFKEWEALYGEPPTAVQWGRQVEGSQGRGVMGARRWPHVGAVRREFGSWNKGLAAAGFEARKKWHSKKSQKRTRKQWTNESIIECIRTWHEEHGWPPTQGDWHKNEKYPSVHIVARRFGTWNKAIEAAGLKPFPQTTTRREIEKYLFRR